MIFKLFGGVRDGYLKRRKPYSFQDGVCPLDVDGENEWKVGFDF